MVEQESDITPWLLHWSFISFAGINKYMSSWNLGVVHDIVRSGGPLIIKIASYEYRDPDVKDKTVSWPSYL